jgi:hypothetical protein
MPELLTRMVALGGGDPGADRGSGGSGDRTGFPGVTRHVTGFVHIPESRARFAVA